MSFLLLNPVGYAGQNLRSEGDQKFVTSQFLNVGNASEGVSIQALTPPADRIEQAADDGLSLLELGPGGETVGYFLWTFCEDAGKEGGFGWMDMMGGFVYATKKLLPSAALWCQNDAEDAFALQSSGEVCKSSVAAELLTDGDQRAVANPFPVKLNIQNITPDDAEAAADNGLSMLELGPGGETVGYFLWTWCEDAGTSGGYGWMDMMGGFIYATKEIDVGEALWCQNDAEDVVTLTIDPPESIAALAD